MHAQNLEETDRDNLFLIDKKFISSDYASGIQLE
jgi:hypothetical protein